MLMKLLFAHESISLHNSHLVTHNTEVVNRLNRRYYYGKWLYYQRSNEGEIFAFLTLISIK